MKVFTFKNMFTLTCFLLTLALIYQVLFTFEVTRPTTTSKEEKELEITDLPEVVVCLDPGLSFKTLEKNGYIGTELEHEVFAIFGSDDHEHLFNIVAIEKFFGRMQPDRALIQNREWLLVMFVMKPAALPSRR